MNIAVLVKQVTSSTAATMDELSRRAVAQGVELAAAVGDGTCTAITLGDPAAEDVLREAIAWGRTCSVMTDGVLVRAEPATCTTALDAAQHLAVTLTMLGPFDLVLLGARSGDHGTGLLGAHLAELLGLPFAASARYLSMQARKLHVRCEHDAEWLQLTVEIPAIVSCAAGLIQPCEATPTARALVPAELIRTSTTDPAVESFEASATAPGTSVVVVAPPGSTASAQPDASSDGDVVHLRVEGSDVEEDIAHAVGAWAMRERPGTVVVPDSTWGREIAGRVGAQLAGLAITVRTGAVAASDGAAPTTTITAVPASTVRVVSRTPRTSKR